MIYTVVCPYCGATVTADFTGLVFQCSTVYKSQNPERIAPDDCDHAKQFDRGVSGYTVARFRSGAQYDARATTRI